MRLNAAPIVALAALLLVAVPLAGCTDRTGGPDGGVGGADGDGGDGAGDGPQPLYASFEEALAADGTVLAPEGSDSPVRLKVLEPTGRNQTTGSDSDQPVAVLLYDGATNEPITDADFSADNDKCNRDDAFCAWHPSMGHGTAPEDSPVHVAHGEYHGETHWLMAGTWEILFNPQLASGEVLNFAFEVCVDSCE